MEYPVTAHIKRFNLLMSEMDTAYHDATTRLGLSDSAMLILYTVCCFDGECPLSALTAIASKQTVNSALRKLEKDGLVRSGLLEGRKKKVSLTREGWEYSRRTVLPLIEIENEIFEAWTDEERELYFSLTERYLSDFKEKIKAL